MFNKHKPIALTKTRYNFIWLFEVVKRLPAEASSNTRLSDWQSEKYCFAIDLKSMLASTGLDCGKRKGEEIAMEDGPLSKESGSHKHPGFPTKSITDSLKKNLKKFIE